MKWIDVPPAWLVLGVGLLWLQTAWAPTPFAGRAGDVLGWALVAAGVALGVLAAIELRRARTTIVPHREPVALVKTGVFRWSRNPIYLGDLLVLVGVGLIWSAVVVVAVAPAFVWIVTRRFILPEEARLRRGFGPTFERWAARTRRWI